MFHCVLTFQSLVNFLYVLGVSSLVAALGMYNISYEKIEVCRISPLFPTQVPLRGKAETPSSTIFLSKFSFSSQLGGPADQVVLFSRYALCRVVGGTSGD